jgi:hypothetical protein
MIKGVNKRVIEINNPDSIYFEKAIFYLKPGVRELPSAVSENEINRYVSRLGLEEYNSGVSRKRGKLFIVLLAVAAIAGVAVAFMGVA